MASSAQSAPFDEHVRLERRDERVRRVLVEHDRRVDRRQRGDDLGAFGLRRDRPAWSLVRPNRPIRIHADNQRVAERPRVLQVAQMARMQQVEDAVGEDDRLAGGAQALDEAGGVSVDRHVRPSAALKCTFGENVQRWRGR